MKRLVLLSLVALGYMAQAQSIGTSPYAAFGVGDVKYDNSLDINSMGGISTAYINDFTNKFNFRNPANNGNLDLFSFNIEATNENDFYKSNYQNIDSKNKSTYLSNISIALPISKKVKFGMGYQPYSSKTYNIVSSQLLSDGETAQATRFTGSGQVSTVQGALSYKINKELSIGYRTNFYFGNLYDLEEVTFSNADLVSGYRTKNKVLGFGHTLGASYQKTFSDNKKLTLGATHSFGISKNSESFYTSSTYYYVGDTKLNETEISKVELTGQRLIPTESSFGVGYGADGKWFASTQFDYKKGGAILHQGKDFQLNNSYRIAAGGWYLPNYNNFRNYFSRVTYRFGAYYEKGSLNLKPAGASGYSNVNQFAVTMGAMLPFANANINRMNGLDVGVEIGKRGSMQNNLINETFVNLRIGLTFADKWFTKRQYN